MKLLPVGSWKENTEFDKALVERFAHFFHDPLGFVRFVFPWGEDGTELAKHEVDEWQIEFLRKLGDELQDRNELSSALRMAAAAGHGCGKSALVAWIIIWFMSTRPNAKGVITANTQGQLSGKTWPELSKWHRLAINRHWFQWTATKFYHVSNPAEYCITATPWSETNSEAFAGLHSTHVIQIYDEASAVADSIWTVSEGALTTDGAMWFCFGNPTRTTGRFYECFHKHKHRWSTYNIDCRKARMTNKSQIQEWIDDYGEDSDFVRVRVRGEFPRQSSTQFISSDCVEDAMERKARKEQFQHMQAVIGVDVARFGSDESIICIRQGDYVHPLKRFRQIDTMELAGQVYEIVLQYGQTPVVCVDGVGIGAGVVDRLNQMGCQVIDVQSAQKSLDVRTYANKRAELWGKMKDWLMCNAILPKDTDLSTQLTSVEYGLNNRLQIQLESKENMRKDGRKSPDLADALAYTFAYESAQLLAAITKAKPVRRRAWV